MKFEIDKKAFAQAVNTANSFTNKPHIDRVYSDKEQDGSDYKVWHFHRETAIATGTGCVYFAICDGAAWARWPVPATIIEDGGPVTISTYMIRPALANAKRGERVTLAVADGKGTLDGDPRPVGLWGPPVPPSLVGLGDAPLAFEIDAGELSAMLSEVAFAVSTEETHYYLNGVYMTAPDGRLRMVATDGHRLAVRSGGPPILPGFFPINGIGANARGIIVPHKTCSLLLKLLDAKAGPVKVTVSPTAVSFTALGLEIRSGLIDGHFPDYDRCIPAPPKQTAVDLDALARAARSHRKPQDRRGFIALNGSAKLRKEERVMGEHGYHVYEERDYALPVPVKIEGDPVHFNARYLAEIGRAFGQHASAIVMRYADPVQPVLMTAPGKPELRVVQMPSRPFA